MPRLLSYINGGVALGILRFTRSTFFNQQLKGLRLYTSFGRDVQRRPLRLIRKRRGRPESEQQAQAIQGLLRPRPVPLAADHQGRHAVAVGQVHQTSL